MTFKIREAQAEDFEEIALLHTRSWQATYRGILSDRFLDQSAIQDRKAAWRRFFAEPAPGRKAFVALDPEGRMQGFVALGRGSEAGYDAEIENLHVLPEAHGRGLGKKLVAAAADFLREAGHSSVYLWVYDDNKAACIFYERLGAVTDAKGHDPFAGADAPHSRMGWHDLAALSARCR